MHGRLIRLLVPVYVLSLAVVGMLWARELAARATAEEAQLAADAHLAAVVAVATDAPPPVGDGPTGLVTVTNPTGAAPIIAIGGEELPAALEPGAVVWPWSEPAAFVNETELAGPIEVTTWWPTDDLRSGVRRSLLVAIGALVTAGAALAAAAHPLAVVATRPLRRLGQTADDLATGSLTARADTEHGPDEIRQVAAAVNQLADQMAVAVERERIFVTSASHHFGNLLTPLRLRVETLRAELAAANRAEPALAASGVHATEAPAADATTVLIGEVMAELDRLEAVAEQLMQLNRAENDETTPAVIDLGPLVDDAVRSWQPVADFAGVTLDCDRPERVEAIGLAWAVTEILDNLIDNAIKYGQGSPVVVRVLLGLDNVRVSVGDGGPGMDRDQLDLAPVRFWRGAEHQNRPGSGLGLAIVQALAARCGARFTMRNRADGGLEASVALRRPGANDHGSR
ncbi:MAG: HAMP domain-containing sensor histidine kinase [Actinomycetota bacterium]